MLKKYSNCIINQNKIFFVITILTFFWTLNVWAFSEPVYSGIKKIEITKELFLELETYFKPGCNRENELCLPSNKLFLTYHSTKNDFSNLVSAWNNYTFVYFVKLSKNKYFVDLDRDGSVEIALYPMIAGNNPVTDAYIYSIVDNKIVHFGMGRFHFEWGPYVKDVVKGKWIEPQP